MKLSQLIDEDCILPELKAKDKKGVRTRRMGAGRGSGRAGRAGSRVGFAALVADPPRR